MYFWTLLLQVLCNPLLEPYSSKQTICIFSDKKGHKNLLTGTAVVMVLFSTAASDGVAFFSASLHRYINFDLKKLFHRVFFSKLRERMPPESETITKDI